MLYVTEYRVINESIDGVSLYSCRENTAIMVSKGLYEILSQLRETYKDNPIDEKDPCLQKLLQSECIETLYRYRFLTDNTNLLYFKKSSWSTVGLIKKYICM